MVMAEEIRNSLRENINAAEAGASEQVRG